MLIMLTQAILWIITNLEERVSAASVGHISPHLLLSQVPAPAVARQSRKHLYFPLSHSSPSLSTIYYLVTSYLAICHLLSVTILLGLGLIVHTQHYKVNIYTGTRKLRWDVCWWSCWNCHHNPQCNLIARKLTLAKLALSCCLSFVAGFLCFSASKLVPSQRRNHCLRFPIGKLPFKIIFSFFSLLKVSTSLYYAKR